MKELIQKLEKGYFVNLKVNYIYPRKCVLEITNIAGIVIEQFEPSKPLTTDNADECIKELQLLMVHKAAEYQNNGLIAIINPFIN